MSKTTKLVFATHNRNKLEEVSAMLPAHIDLLSLDDIGAHEDIAETADTIEGNAIIKAKYVYDTYNIPCFADDTGLEVAALNNEPGVYSARYAGEENNSEANIAKLLKNLEAHDDRSARFKTAIAFISDEAEEVFLGICDGTITKQEYGESGFGYDPVFLPEGSEKTFAQMSQKQKSIIGHRGKAIAKLIHFLAK